MQANYSTTPYKPNLYSSLDVVVEATRSAGARHHDVTNARTQGQARLSLSSVPVKPRDPRRWGASGPVWPRPARLPQSQPSAARPQRR